MLQRQVHESWTACMSCFVLTVNDKTSVWVKQCQQLCSLQKRQNQIGGSSGGSLFDGGDRSSATLTLLAERIEDVLCKLLGSVKLLKHENPLFDQKLFEIIEQLLIDDTSSVKEACWRVGSTLRDDFDHIDSSPEESRDYSCHHVSFNFNAFNCVCRFTPRSQCHTCQTIRVYKIATL